MKYSKHNEDTNIRVFEIVPTLIWYKQQAEENLLSTKGIEIRVNRSVQVEGVFGIEKQDRHYTRMRRRGITKVSTEMMLILLGLNIKKLYHYYDDSKLPKYWTAPDNLMSQSFKKISYKRLSKKGKRTNDKLYKIKQA